MGFNKLYRPLMRFIGNFFPKDHHKIMFDSGPSFSDNSRVLFEYIYSTIAERFIRPLAGERKNLLFFGSGKMASVSAAYHRIISPCKMQGVPILHYLRNSSNR